ncbi:MAG: peptidoglycan DD-metalloendopeptidase family protein [Bacterioplanes sp.]|nr:peptidoglycan DD-metalloendopeptidase family protein [Bacterioplanes sp.]
MRVTLVLLLVWLSISSVLADDERRLAELQKEIQQLQQWLNSAKDEYSQLDQALRQSDIAISDINRQIDTTRTQLNEEQQRLKKLRLEQGQLQQLQQQHRQYLIEQIQAAHKMGEQSPIKLLLDQDDPQQAQRTMRYFAYFNEARVERIRVILAELDRLNRLSEIIVAQEQQLRATEARLLQQSRERQTRQKQQQRLLTQLAQQMQSEQQSLRRKEADQQRLEQLLNEVSTLLANSARRNDERPFRQLRGKLPQPVNNARVVGAFGQRDPQTRVRWEGWLMRTSEGQTVQAIHHGQVVFADWLRGFGLVIILDHGEGYLSLYAHNQTLFRDVGTWVNQGDILASSGRSSSTEQAQLYFEIRHKGKPQDPAAWLQRR